jgi:hypothetical protein
MILDLAGPWSHLNLKRLKAKGQVSEPHGAGQAGRFSITETLCMMVF